MPTRRTIALAALALPAPALAQLADPGFESTTPLEMIPTELGVWGGDLNSVPAGIGPVTPAEGARMLSIEGTHPACSPGGGTSGDMLQLLPIPDDFGPGDIATATVMVNRLDAPDADTMFTIRVSALDGEPATYRTGCGSARPSIGTAATDLVTDADPSTWESIATQLVIPDGTTFLVFAVSAREDVNNADEPPFDGHFADAASVTFSHPACSGADLAEPFGSLDFSDVIAFLAAFAGMDAAADLAAPFGQWDFSDVLAFLALFGDGCP